MNIHCTMMFNNFVRKKCFKNFKVKSIVHVASDIDTKQ